LCLNLNLHSWT